MFAWRKSKPGCDDSLVPHGFVGQATEEFMSPRNAESTQPDLPPSDANQIPIPKFRQAPQPIDGGVRRGPVSVPAQKVRPSSAATNPQTKSAPAFWRPLPPVQELNKLRMALQEERAKGSDRRVEPVLSTSVAASPVATSQALSIAAPAAPSVATPIACSVTPSVHPEQLSSSALIETTNATISLATPKSKPTRVAAWIESGKTTAAAFNAEMRRRWLLTANFGQQLWARRVRIRLAARVPFHRIPFARIAAAPVLAWRGLVTGARQNARLATSMTMAIFSALLALGLIVATRRYDPAAHATARNAVLPEAMADSTPIATSNPGPAKAAESSAVKPRLSKTIVGQSANAVSVVQAAERKPIRKRAHRSGDDDYIAPDTYVSYGKR